MGLRGPVSAGCSAPPNPNPKVFKVEHCHQNGPLCVVYAQYSGCTTYGGNKVLVLEATEEEVAQASTLDPHFLGEKMSPIARFPGDPGGYAQAIAYCKFHIDSGLRWYVVKPITGTKEGPFKTRHAAQEVADNTASSYLTLQAEPRRMDR